MRSPLKTFVSATAALACATALAFTTAGQAPVGAQAAPSDGFLATFDTPSDFYDRFDYGFSGQDPASNGNADRITSWTGDHDASCGSPDSQRTINVERNTNGLFGGTYRDFDDMFWSCRSHLMTGVSSVGYNIAWFSPKPTFTDITRVCWDINLTEVASRKWTQVLFVSEADALSHPSPRGSGGFDLGYTNPMFQEPGGPTTEVLPTAGNLAGIQVLSQGLFRWFENQTQWTTDHNVGSPVVGNFDKAARYTHCVEQLRPGTIRITQERPDSFGGFQQIDVPGTIPRGPLRVVFQDDNYNGPKSENYNPAFNTWHWDNIVVETGERITVPTDPPPPPSAGAGDTSNRLLDTRSGSDNTTADGQFQHGGMITPGRPLELQVAGRNGIPGNATAAYLNVTATGSNGPGHVTVYPCGSQPKASTLNYNYAGHTVANLAYTDLSARGTVCIAALTATHLVVDATGHSTTDNPTAMNPARMLDTRTGANNTTADGQFQHGGIVTPGRPLELQIAGRNGIPGNATSAFLNITATNGNGPGYITVYPCGSQPKASTLNYNYAGHTVANLAYTDLSAQGTVCIAALTATHVVVDATGHTTTDNPAAINPARMLDTRSGSDNTTSDGQFQHGGTVSPGRPLELQIAGRNGIPGDATSAFLNITATNGSGPGYITVYPCDSQPKASTLNYNYAGHTVANLAHAELSSQGTVCIAALAATHVVVDATGHGR